jgi:hypothetical protein
MITLAPERASAPVVTREAMERRVAADVLRHFGGRAPEPELRAMAAEAVDRLWSEGVTVTAFIPALAIRDVKERLQLAEMAAAVR